MTNPTRTIKELVAATREGNHLTTEEMVRPRDAYQASYNLGLAAGKKKK